MTPRFIQHYISQSIFTDLSVFSQQIGNLTTDISSIRSLVHGLLMHSSLAPRYGVVVSEKLKSTRELLFVSKILEYAQKALPLTSSRHPSKKLIASCRDFAVLACALLRNISIPSRVRIVFVDYIFEGYWTDHWVCEYWNEDLKCWKLFETLFDDKMLKEKNIYFNPFEVPENRFKYPSRIVGEGNADSLDLANYGVKDSLGNWYTGRHYVIGNLVRDIFALQKLELLPPLVVKTAQNKERVMNDIKKSVACVTSAPVILEILEGSFTFSIEEAMVEIERIMNALDRSGLGREILKSAGLEIL